MALELDSAAITAEEFRLLRDLIHEHCGVFFGDEMRSVLARRLAPRLQAHGLETFRAYHRFLRYDPDRQAELDQAVDVLTTNETYLFREPLQLKAFSQEVLPMLANERARTRRLRVWSAGCSTGEEAYTLAILLEDSGLFGGWDLSVFGCDISHRVLEVARAGAYGAHAFRSAEAEGIRRWFRPRGGKWVIDDAIRRRVHFAQVNLLDAPRVTLVERSDVVFCRNVMIYFDLPIRKRVVRSLHERLSEGGFLLLGHAESLLNISADFELVHLENDLVYRKPRARG